MAPKAVKGVLDLSSWDFDRDGPISLSGEYAFYWNQLLRPQDFMSGSSPEKSGFIDVPGFWHTFNSDKIHPAADGYATYRLKIVFNPNSRPSAVTNTSKKNPNGDLKPFLMLKKPMPII